MSYVRYESNNSGGYWYRHWKALNEDRMTNWIPLTGPGSRMPTREDADETGCVAARDAKGSLWFAGIRALKPGPAVAWHPIAKYTPPVPREIKMHGRTYVLKEEA